MCDPLQSSDCLSLVVSLVGAIASILVALVSGWMAIETRRMAVATKRSVDLEYLPIMGIRDLRFTVSPANIVQVDAEHWEATAIGAVTVGVELHNAGRVGLHYRTRNMRVTFSGRTIDKPNYVSRGGVVLPGSSTWFWHPTLLLEPAIDTFPAVGRVECEFEYWRDPNSKHEVLKATIEYVISGAAPGSPTNWMFVDEPEST